ncbi:MAG: S41 family peptidase [Pseudomonadota bacterium]
MTRAYRLIVTIALALSISLAARAASDRDAPIPAAEVRADFEALYAGLKSAHVDLFAHRSRTDYDARYEDTLARFTAPMSRFEVQVAFQRFVAYGNVAHARIEFPSTAYESFRAAGGRTFPIYPRIVAGRAYVGEDYSSEPGIQSGDEIVAINGEPMSAWLERTAAHVSADTPYIAHSLLEFRFPSYLWLELGEVEAFRLTLKGPTGRRDLTIEATTREAQRAAAAEQPVRFSLDSSARTYRMLEGRIGYLQPGPFYNVEDPTAPWDNVAFLAFVDQAFGHFIESGASDLVIDLRQNPGGDNSFSDAMLAWIAAEPFRFCSAFLIRSSDEAAASNEARLAQQDSAVESVSTLFARQYASVPRGETFEFEIPYAQPRAGGRFEGRVFALINRHSYSNAVNVAAMIQDYELGTIAGEKTSDMATTFGAMETFELPRTGIEVGFPKAHIIRPSGDRRTDGVTPDWVIASPIVAGADDAVLDALLQRIRGG